MITLEQMRAPQALRNLELYGPGPRPCVDGAANWLGCSACGMSCILYAGGTKAYNTAMAKKQPKEPKPAPVVSDDFAAAKTRLETLAGKVQRGNKLKTSGMHVYPPNRKSPKSPKKVSVPA